MGLTEQERAILVKLKLEKSEKTLTEARKAAEMQMWATAANRLYYAAYYAVSALLLKQGVGVKTHEGVIQMFGLHFVKTGKVQKDVGRMYSDLFNTRLMGDYDDTFDLEEKDVMPKLDNAEHIIRVVKDCIDERNT